MRIGSVSRGVRVGALTMGVGAALLMAETVLPGSDAQAMELGSPGLAQCIVPAEYYEMDLVPTRSIPGASRARGQVALTFRSSPFGVDLSTDGSYQYHLEIEVSRLPQAGGDEFVVWASTPRLDEVQRLGVLRGDGVVTGSVAWNKFLVFVTLEPAAVDEGMWTGPVVLRGISRSGLMHTMAGHGAFEEENCATYGY